MPEGLAGETITANQIVGINNLVLAKAGEYVFVVFVDHDLKAETPLVVDFLDVGPTGPTH